MSLNSSNYKDTESTAGGLQTIGYQEESFGDSFSGLLQGGGNLLLDYIGIWFPSQTDNFKKWIREGDTEELEKALAQVSKEIAEADAKQAAAMEKSAQDMGLWGSIIATTGSSHVKKAYQKASNEEKRRRDKSTLEYSINNAELSRDLEKLRNMRDYPDSAYNSIGELRQDYGDVLTRYGANKSKLGGGD